MADSSEHKKYTVHFEPDNIDIVVGKGANLMEAAVDAGVHINASCGGAGVCGTCNVLIKSGQVESPRTDKVSDKDYKKGIRQSCQSRILSDLIIEIPAESRLEKAVLTREIEDITSKAQAALVSGWRFDPPVKKLYLELTAPTLEDNIDDLSRLLRGIKRQYKLDNISVDFDVLPGLAQILRAGIWQVTATILMDENISKLINIEAGDSRTRHYALAFDIGTTAVRGQLLDLNKGRVITHAIEYNRQISYGEDVISRIAWSQKTGGLKRLQQAVIATINDMNGKLIDSAGIEVKDVSHIVVAANTVMVQLLLGIDPKYLRLSPYVPTVSTVPLLKAKSIGINTGEHVYLYAVPSVASYVGGDIVSGILGAGVHQREETTLYIDIGTNGEIVIGNSDLMLTASCSAGPTFEGGGIKHGMIATPGAIEGFDINPSNLEPVITTIDNAKAKGICGSGLINIAAALLKAGVVTQNGKFNTDLPTDRIREGEDGYEYILANAADTQIGKDIVITEIDMDNLIRSKAAMYAGYKTLIKSIGSKLADIERVIIAGTFGSNLNIENAITIGLLPDLPRDRYIFIGNGSLLGARLISFSSDLLRDGERVAGMMTNIELSENTDFMSNYMAALFLPHTNADEFPSVIIKKG
ncbi:MAG: ASKHA domain-containing protein [Chloroflexota bacterium]